MRDEFDHALLAVGESAPENGQAKGPTRVQCNGVRAVLLTHELASESLRSMARPLRILVADGWSHVTSRGNRRESIYRTEAKREMLLLEAAEITLEYEQPATADPATPWGDSWTSPDTIPTRVRLHLADGRRSHLLTLFTRSQGVPAQGASGTTVRQQTPGRAVP